jgi:polyisoprenoid-binding protein YceI
MSRWLIDPDHTVATFTVRHMLIADVHGHFSRIAGELMCDPEDPAATTFDLARVPHLICRSTGVELENGAVHRMRGALSLHGVTRAEVMDVQRFGPVRSDDGDTSLGLRLIARIDREAYGMTWNVPLAGGVMVGTEVNIVVDIEADLAEVGSGGSVYAKFEKASVTRSESAGKTCMQSVIASTRSPRITAFATSAIRSEACGPTTWKPRILRVCLSTTAFAKPSRSSMALPRTVSA